MTARTPILTIAREAKASLQDLLVPSHAGWAAAEESSLALEPTPLERIPSAYVQKAWESRPHGVTRSVGLRALVSDASLVLRVAWSAREQREGVTDHDVYADACGVLFPLDGKDAELSSMGSEEKPVRAWYWRAGAPGPFAATATGLGTVTRDPHTELLANGEWRDGEWAVVFAHPLGDASAPLARGVELPVGLAVWSGAAGERAGLKSHTPMWHRLAVD